MQTIKNFMELIGTPGFSETLLKNHFSLYEGYVKNVNILDQQLLALETIGGANGPEYNELKRRYAWEYNGMYLHELYFQNLKNGGVAMDSLSPLTTALVSQFGSFENWKNDFIATGAMRGIGWALLVCTAQGSLKNIWINEHDLGVLVGATPILVMDVFEHSFVLDYGLKRMDYIQAFLAAIDWSAVSIRYIQ